MKVQNDKKNSASSKLIKIEQSKYFVNLTQDIDIEKNVLCIIKEIYSIKRKLKLKKYAKV